MRRSQAPSELGRLVSPLGRLFDAAWRRMHWWVAAMALLYGVSGITVIRPDEVAIVQRWGRLVGDTPALQERDPGILFALPRPMDRVVRVKTKHVGQLSIETLAEPAQWFGRRDTLDPLVVGYALTGDQNIVHVSMLAHYRVRDPADWAFYGPRSEDILRVEVTAAMVRSLGEMGVDHVLADGRKDLIAAATRRAQAGLDAAHAGLALVSLELTGLSPPRALSEDFDAVQSAYIETETQRKDAQAFGQDVIPKGHADADASVQAARAYAAVSLARARGDAEGFLALVQQYRASPSVVRERLYRDMVEKTIGGAQAVRWVPPAARGAHERMRVLVNPEEVATPQEPGGGPSEERP